MPPFCSYCGQAAATSSSSSCSRCHRQHVPPPSSSSPLPLNPETAIHRALFTQRRFFPALVSDPAKPQAAMSYCFVERFRGKHVHTFHLYREGDNSFVLACSMAATQAGPIFFHTNQLLFNNADVVLAQVPQTPAHSQYVAALLPSSLMGTEFLLTTGTSVKLVQTGKRPAAKASSSRGGDAEAGQLLLGGDVSAAAAAAPTPYTTSSPTKGTELALFRFATNISATAPNQVKAFVRANPRCEAATASTMRQRARQLTAQTRAPSDLSALLVRRLRAVATSSTSSASTNLIMTSKASSAAAAAYKVQADPMFNYAAIEASNDVVPKPVEAFATPLPPQNDGGDGDDQVLVFVNRKPAWNDKLGGWTLDFNGRVAVRSKKNFILVVTSGGTSAAAVTNEAIAVRFGKASKHRFNLDYRHPYSPLSAFAVAMSMFASKLAVAW